jgi:hypothetical protein
LTALAVTAVPCPRAPDVNVKLVGLIASVKSAGAAAIFSVNVAVCTNAPEVPVTVTVLVPATALAAAVTVSVCGVPGVTVGVAGFTVTPAGSPLTAIPTPAVNPFTPLTETAVDPPAPPAVTLTVVGFTEIVKSAGGTAVTLSATAPLCTCAPEVPVIVTVPELVAAVAAAVSVIVSVVPGAIITEAGFAVTPDGKPERVTAICALYPFTAVDVTVICWVAPPAVSATFAGATASVKSSVTTALEPHPPAVNPRQPNIRQPNPNNQRPTPAPREFHLFSKIRAEKIMRLLPVLK